MHSKKPHVVVFFGGESGNQDLSLASSLWFSEYVPRSKYQITPVEVTPDGQWKVPLGSLPTTGSVQTMWQRLFEAIRPLSPAKALERLLARPVDLMMTFIRGKGGDDGSMHSLGQTLSIPVFGSSAQTAQLTSNKYASMQTIGEMTSVPYTRLFKAHVPTEEILEDVQEEFSQSVFLKPVSQEGSLGIARLDSMAAIRSALQNRTGDILLQEHRPGTEVSLTLYQDAHGSVVALPPTIIVPQKAGFYDELAKRRAGRVKLHTPHTVDNMVIAEAEEIARDVWNELGCQGIACVDMVASDGALDVLEVNTVPTFTQLTPTIHQLKTAGLHPTRLFDSLIARHLR